MRRMLLLGRVIVMLAMAAVIGSQGTALAAPGSVREEEASWGSIKAMYRGGALDCEGAAGSSGAPGSLNRDARYPLRDSPANALEKLRQSYELMDPVAYLDCLAEDFIFYVNPEDQANNPNMPPEWYKVDEASMHYNMFGAGTSIEYITLSLAQVCEPVEFPSPDPGEPSEWEYHENYDLTLHYFDGLTIISEAGAVFMLRVDQDQSGPGGEDLWEVESWWDVERFEVSPVESSSWATIKALFR